MKAAYLLPCTCGNKVRVDAGQAGAKVPCTCGQQLSVPTFRALGELELAAEEGVARTPPRSEWSASRGLTCSFGILISMIAVVLICYHVFMYVQMWDGGESWKQAHLDEMRESVDHLAPADALVDFQEMAGKGLTVDGIPPWANIAAVRDSSHRWIVTELIALAIGLVSLAASLIGARPVKAT